MNLHINSPVFNDRLLIIIGIPVVALMAFLILGREFVMEHDLSVAVSILGSLLTTVIIWLGVRKIVVFLWERYPWERNPVKHLVIEIAAILGYTLLVGMVLVLFWLVFKPEFIKAEHFVVNIFFTLLITFFITSLHEGWFFFRNWKETLVISEKLAKENIQGQLETLKSQISPHFLFNNLNTLASLIEEDRELAVEYVQRTADYYRSILNIKDRDVISLREEMELIGTYYYLQKKRYGENLVLNSYLPGNLEETVVAPLALQMLFENALKHNVISRDNPLTVSIDCNDEYIVVTNNLHPREDRPESGGVGLKNISDRYRFLSSKGVTVSKDDNKFVVRVPVLKMQG